MDDTIEGAIDCALNSRNIPQNDVALTLVQNPLSDNANSGSNVGSGPTRHDGTKPEIYNLIK